MNLKPLKAGSRRNIVPQLKDQKALHKSLTYLVEFDFQLPVLSCFVVLVPTCADIVAVVVDSSVKDWPSKPLDTLGNQQKFAKASDPVLREEIMRQICNDRGETLPRRAVILCTLIDGL
ncbi:hypothetical protein EYZ11_005663 [Aspergillus tanneri]|uniref:Uncharacterized protein n=1 Tax=Aspergillus tanneri TaxID=1220188 RepID=A0A4S3JHP8_9EURO|nr:hypothetical protein EYZ11_005663 [Aspergillus tanneri]